jgi:hypothetical protein
MRNGKDRLNGFAHQAPPVPPAEALRRSLLYAMFQAVTGDDMGAIVAAQVEKAKAGDLKAAKFIVDMVQAGGPAGTAGVSQVTVVGVGQAANPLDALRREIVGILANDGPQSDSDLAEDAGQSVMAVRKALDHRWFEKEPDGWHLTAEARAEVLEGPGE